MKDLIEVMFDKIDKIITEKDDSGAAMKNIRINVKKQDYAKAFSELYETFFIHTFSKDNGFWISNYLRIIAEKLELEDRVSELKKFIRNQSKINRKIFNLSRVDIIATIHFSKSGLNSRYGPAFSGYRPTVYFDENGSSASFEFEPDIAVFPGELSKARIQFSFWEQYRQQLSEMQTFKVKEAGRIVANGIINEIVNLELKM